MLLIPYLDNITLSNVDDSPQTFPTVQSIDGSIHLKTVISIAWDPFLQFHLIQPLECVGDEGLQGHLPPHDSLHQLGHLRPRLPSPKCSSLSVPAGDQLERSG